MKKILENGLDADNIKSNYRIVKKQLEIYENTLPTEMDLWGVAKLRNCFLWFSWDKSSTQEIKKPLSLFIVKVFSHDKIELKKVF